MIDKLEEYDINKLKKARKSVVEVYEYNYTPSSSIAKKLETIIRKLDKLIGEEKTI